MYMITSFKEWAGVWGFVGHAYYIVISPPVQHAGKLKSICRETSD